MMIMMIMMIITTKIKTLKQTVREKGRVMRTRARERTVRAQPQTYVVLHKLKILNDNNDDNNSEGPTTNLITYIYILYYYSDDNNNSDGDNDNRENLTTNLISI